MSTRNPSEKIAVVGMGCVFPDAANPDEFWQNILAKRISIAKVSDAPEESRIFDVGAHFRPELYGAADKRDKSYTDLFAMVRDFQFDPRKFRIPPTVAEHMDDNQKIALASADQALSGVSLEGIAREKISVFVGSSMIGNHHHEFLQRVDFQRFEHHLVRHQEFCDAIPSDRRDALLRDLEKLASPRGRPVTEDSAPGILPNIIAARIASVFDFHGHAYVVDAACASGLAAIICGMQHLSSGESDLVLCGAADMLSREIGHIYFSGIGALSPDGSYPFDERANGFVIGQGGGVLALKRLSDALRDGDTVHAVIAGYGQTSDGKGKAIAAPNPVWQARTIERALEMAGFHPDSIELIEAHGTATKVGDASEIEAMKTSFAKLGSTRSGHCAVGSVKSNIGHLKSAAGIAGVIKTIQALRHRTLPPSANCAKVNPKLELDGSPFRIIVEPGEWEAKSHSRRAGVSAFGFGGANYHLVLEEFDPNASRAPAPARPASDEHAPQSDRLAEIVLVSGSTRREVASRVDDLLEKISRTPDALSGLVLEESYRSDSTDEFRLAVVFDSFDDLRSRVSLWKQTDSDHALKLLRAKGVFHGEGTPRNLDQTAFLFPGQGSQYPDMMLELQDLFPCTRRISARIDAWWEKHAGAKVSDLVSSRSRGKEKTEAILKDTRNTHPALLHANLVAATLLQDMGVRPAWMIGHSAGEVVALAAAGRLDLSDALRTMDHRSRAFTEMDTTDFGKMAAVRCDRKRLEELVAASGLPVAIANINSPEQIIASGPSEAIDAFCALLDREGVKRAALNVSHAFHSPVVAPAAASFGKTLRRIRFHRGHSRVLANEICAEYPESDDAIRTLLESQITGSVDFCGGVEELYQRGVRVFVEVGPGSVLGNLAQSILKDRDATILSINHRNGDTLESLQKALAALFAEGIPLQPIPPARRSSAHSVFSGTQSAPSVALPPEKSQTRRIVYSGVSVGLPGSFRKGFQDDNFDRLFDGQNFIERISDTDKARLAELRVTKVEKSTQGPVFQVLETLEDVIQLAGKIGKIDPLADYALDPKETETATSAILHAIAAGYEALRDAHIPLVREYTRTASGSLLPDRWTLPQQMQKRTGVIFAHGFPMVEPVAAEVSRHLAHKYGGRLRTEIVELYQELVGKIHDQDAKSFLTDWFARNHHQLSSTPGSQEVYAFNHRFIQQISALANNRLAAYVGALGPNFQINAACSSTCTSITLAEEMIRSGRADRFLVIGSDDPTSETTMPYLGAAFLSTGAATSEPDLYKAALPFDRRRNGMIMGAGAVGIVVEAAEHAQSRGISPVCELLGTHVFNTAGHHARLDIPRYAEELDEFLARMESSHSLSRQDIAPRLLYVSHETYTPARGGCSESEATALKHVFGDRFTQIEVTNTKGMTGHTMGASIEDAVAARALQTGRVPPVVNHKIEDPALAGLKLSTGGSHDREYALRMAAGFGSQGNYILLRKCTGPADRIADPARHHAWLASVSGQSVPELEIHGRVLRIKDKTPGSVLVKRPLAKAASVADPIRQAPKLELPATTAAVLEKHQERSLPKTATAPDIAVRNSVFQVVSEVTGYSPEMLDLDMEIEADLGVDTVKQATILAMLGERFGLDASTGFQISAYPTIGHLVALFAKHDALATPQAHIADRIDPIQDKPGGTTSGGLTDSDTTKMVVQVVSEVTGYPPEMLDVDMEIEADLGVDTVKQATILALLGERFGLDANTGFQISAYPTIGHIVALFARKDRVVSAPSPGPSMPAPAASVADRIDPILAKPSVATTTNPTNSDTTRMVVQVVSEVTGYPPEMLEPDMEIEADLGVDTVKQATILAMLGERFGLDANTGFQISAYPTIGHLVALFSRNAQTAEPVKAQAPDSLGEPFPADTDILLRHVLRLEDEPLGAFEGSLESSRILLLADSKELADGIAKRLTPVCKELRTLRIPENGDPAQARQAFEPLESFQADVWIDLGGMVDGIEPDPSDLDAARRILSRLSDCRYAICKRVEELGIGKPSKILCVSGSPESPSGGLLRGFHLSLGKEWNASTTIIDIDTGDGVDILFDRLHAELTHNSGSAHVSWRTGLRQAWKCLPAATPSCIHPLELGPQDTLLVTGGGNGIAARVLVALAHRYPCRFVVLGRTDISESQSYLEQSSWEESELPRRKDELRQALSAEGKKVSPAVLEREFELWLKRRETTQTLATIQNLGRDVRYVQVDVCDLSALKEAVSSLDGGPITAIVHAAGIDASRPIAKKSLEEFSSVHRVKTLGALHLAKVAPPGSLKLFVAFTSISGVFGNGAQLDYAAANAFLDSWVRHLGAKHPGLRAKSLAWSGWSDVGMAWRNDWVRANADKSGLHLIPPAHGVAAALRELDDATASSPTILHKGLGGMLDRRWSERQPVAYPLIDRIETLGDGTATAHHLFSVEQDEFLNQHRLNKTPLMPGVGFMEFMAEFHATLERSGGHHRFRNLSFHDAFKLHREQAREAWIRAARSDEPGSWDMRIFSRFESKIGGVVQDRDYCAARVSAGRFDPPIDLGTWSPSIDTADVRYSGLLAGLDRIPQNVVFGPLFHESRNPGRKAEDDVVVRWDARGLRTPCILPRAQSGNPRYPLDRFIMNPCMLDSIHQAGVIHGVLTTGSVHLPYGAQEFVVLAKQDRPGTYQVEVALVDKKPDVLVYDIVLRDESGEVQAWVSRSAYHRINS